MKADDYPAARITGSPTLYEGRLYVPVSSREESRVGPENFACCGFRGSVVALDAASGKQLWKTYTIDQKATTDPEESSWHATIGALPAWQSGPRRRSTSSAAPSI